MFRFICPIQQNNTPLNIGGLPFTPLHIQNAPSGAVMSERGDADCTFEMCNGVNRRFISHKGNVT